MREMNLRQRFEKNFGFKFEHGWKYNEKGQPTPDYNNLVGTAPNGMSISIIGPLGKPKRSMAILPIVGKDADSSAKSVEYLQALLRSEFGNVTGLAITTWIGENARPAALENKARTTTAEGKQIQVSGRLTADGAVVIVEITTNEK